MPRRTAWLLLPAAVLLAACTSGPSGSSTGTAAASFPQPATSAFGAGTCQAAAPDLLALGRALSHLGNGPVVDPAAAKALSDSQGRVSALADGAEPGLQQPLRTLVTRVGVVRVSIDAQRYTPAMLTDAASAYDAVLRACHALT